MSHRPTPAQLLSATRRPPRIGTLSADSLHGSPAAGCLMPVGGQAGCGSPARPAPCGRRALLRRGQEALSAAVARERTRGLRPAPAQTAGSPSRLAVKSGENARKLAKVWGPAVLGQEAATPPPAYPEEVPQGEGEAHGQGHGARAAIPPLVERGKDAEHELERQEDLHHGGLAHAHARVQLGRGRRERRCRRAATALPPHGFPAGPPHGIGSLRGTPLAPPSR